MIHQLPNDPFERKTYPLTITAIDGEQVTIQVSAGQLLDFAAGGRRISGAVTDERRADS